MFEFSNPSVAAKELARHRWSASQPGRANCGANDECGYCIEPYHATGCGSVAGPYTAEAGVNTGTIAYSTVAYSPRRTVPGSSRSVP
jgi:hypothetical protein